jgi:hypothetical protein
VHRGEHEPILSRDLFEAVQAKRAANAVDRQVRLRGSAAILTGRLFDDRGNRMTRRIRTSKARATAIMSRMRCCRIARRKQGASPACLKQEASEQSGKADNNSELAKWTRALVIWTRVIAVFTAGLFFAAIVGGIISYYQWQALEKADKTTRDALVASSRAWVAPQNHDFPLYRQVTLMWKWY